MTTHHHDHTPKSLTKQYIQSPFGETEHETKLPPARFPLLKLLTTCPCVVIRYTVLQRPQTTTNQKGRNSIKILLRTHKLHPCHLSTSVHHWDNWTNDKETLISCQQPACSGLLGKDATEVIAVSVPVTGCGGLKVAEHSEFLTSHTRTVPSIRFPKRRHLWMTFILT